MKILVAMSGGVDSSVAAKLLTDAGHHCIGCTMKLHESQDAGEGAHTCCSSEDVEDARAVACRLKIPYYVFDFSGDFREKIIGRFVRSYCEGRTPNPCIDCNRLMKFDKLFLRADWLGCEKVATGHYARVEEREGRYFLKKAADPAKDQSYVLYSLTQAQLARTLFPLGDLRKSETRALAGEGGFLNAQKPDSQDICFVPDGNYAAVIERYTGHAPVPGDFLDTEGKVLGKHRGIIHYTIGQHKGLGLPTEEKLYVVRINPTENTVVLGPSQALFSREVTVRQMHWIGGTPPHLPLRCKAKIRYRQTEQPADVLPDSDGVRILFDEPQRAPTPGQAAVLYDGDVVLGGGEIA